MSNSLSLNPFQCCTSPNQSNSDLGSIQLQIQTPFEIKPASDAQSWQTTYKELLKRRAEAPPSTDFKINGKSLIHSGKAWSFYLLFGFIEALNLTSNAIRLITNNFFNKTAQVIFVGAVVLNIIWSYLALNEANQQTANAKSLKENSLGQDVVGVTANKIETGLFQRKLESIASIIGSLISLAYAALATEARFKKESVTPLLPTSSLLAYWSVFFSTLSTIFLWPLFVSAAKDGITSIFKHFSVQNKADQNLVVLNINFKDDFKGNAIDAFHQLVRREQRPKEMMIRSVNLSGWVINLAFLFFWGVLNLVNYYANPHSEENFDDYWAQKFATKSNETIITMFFVNSSFSVINALLKMFWDGYKSWKATQAITSLQNSHNVRLSFQEAEEPNDDTLPLLQDSDVKNAVCYDKYFAVWTIINLLKQETDNQSLATNDVTLMLHDYGFDDETLNSFKTCGNTPLEYDAITHQIALKLNLIDLI